MNRFKRSYDIHVSKQLANFCSIFGNNNININNNNNISSTSSCGSSNGHTNSKHEFAVCWCHANVTSRRLPMWRGNNIREWTRIFTQNKNETNEINEHEHCSHMKYRPTNIQNVFKQHDKMEWKIHSTYSKTTEQKKKNQLGTRKRLTTSILANFLPTYCYVENIWAKPSRNGMEKKK